MSGKIPASGGGRKGATGGPAGKGPAGKAGTRPGKGYGGETGGNAGKGPKDHGPGDPDPPRKK